MQPVTAAVLLALLAGCVAAFETAGDDACGARTFLGLVGQPAAGIEIAAGADTRIVGPDTLVTLDHVPGRLNIRVDAAGVVTGVDCG